MTSVAIYTGQATIADASAWQQLPSSGPLTKGVWINGNDNANEGSDAGDPVTISVTGQGSTALDGTGSGVIISSDYTPPVFFPVPNTDAIFVSGTAGIAVSWYAY